jgi:hemerythrin
MEAIKYEVKSNLVLEFPLIDRQHSEFFIRLNHLLEVTERTNEMLVIVLAAKLLFEYTEKHFITEEKLMMNINYTEFEYHKWEHDRFRNNFNFIIDNLKSGKTSLAGFRYSVVTEIGDWYVAHIRKLDKVLAKYVRLHGYSESDLL